MRRKRKTLTKLPITTMVFSLMLIKGITET